MNMTEQEFLDNIKTCDNLSFYKIDKYDYRGNDIDENLECLNSNLFSYIDNINKLSIDDYVEIPATTHGDYVPCDVYCISNSRRIKEEFSFVKEVYGAYSYSSLLVKLKLLYNNKELFETIKALLDYPIYDEMDDSELRVELEEEAWNNWLEYDFKRMIESETEEDDIEEKYKLYELFRVLLEKTNTYFESEGNSMYVDLKRMFSQIKYDELKELMEKYKIEQNNANNS